MRFLRDNGLSLFFGGLFLVAAAGQSVAGHAAHNERQVQHGDEAISYGRYLLSSDFGQALLENWQSARQRGSPESKPVGSAHDETGASG